MFSSRWKLLASPGKFLSGQSKPRVVGAILFLLLAIWGGLYLWGQHFFEAAQASCQQYHYEKAAALIKKCLAVWPRDYHTNLLAARICRARAEYPQAEKHLAVCWKQQGKTEEVELEWLLLRAQKGDFLELETPMRKRLDDGHSQATLILEAMAFCYIKDGRYIRAGQILDQWLEIAPNGMAYFWRGMARLKQGAGKGARADFRQALEWDPDLWEARFQLVRLLLAGNDFEEGGEHLAVLEHNHPGRPEVWLLEGMDQFRKGDLEAAENHLDKAVQAMPANAVALTERAKLALEKGRPIEAEQWFRKALEAEPSLIAPHFYLYQCLNLQPGREKEAQIELEKHKECQQRFERQNKILEEVEKSPNDADRLVEAAEFFLVNRQFPMARQLLLRALQAQPNHPKARKHLATSFQDTR